MFDLKDPSQIPAVAEPFFMGFNADVQFWSLLGISGPPEGPARGWRAAWARAVACSWAGRGRRKARGEGASVCKREHG